jgi:trimeric autotransporter adhesin
MSSNIEVKLDVLNQKGSPALFADSLASRPAASFAGRLFVDTDNPSTGIYRDTGTTWIQVADETGTIPTPTLQTVTTAGNTSNVGISVSANGIGIGTSIPASNRLDVHSASGLQATFNGTGVTNAGVQLQSAGVGKWTIQNNYNSAANDFVVTDVLNSINRLIITNTGVGTLTASLSATKTATYSTGGTYGIYGNDNYTIPAATSFGSGGLIFASLQGIQNFTYGGNATYDNSALNGSVVGINQIQFSSTGTITMTQATGPRAMTAGIFQNQFLGATNGTISHLAGIEVLGVYKASTGIATITNAYGLLINNIDDYTSGFAFTNRWGIYQAGASDNNYFAGKVTINDTTITAYRLYVNGTVGVVGSVTAANSSFNGVAIGLGNTTNVSNTNTAVGLEVLSSNTSATGCTGVGQSALRGNNGNYNSAFGTNAMRLNVSGINNCAFGTTALFTNTSSQNSAFGSVALYANTTGGDNNAFGYWSLTNNTTGSANVAFGVATLQYNTTGGSNVAIGSQAGRYISGGGQNAITDNSIYIGAFTYPLANNQTNQIIIGTSTIGLGSNTTIIGNSSTTQTALYGSLTLGTTTNTASALLSMSSTAQGFLPPRMTTAQKNAIATPATGLVVYDTTLNKLALYTGAGWETVTSI